MKIKIENQEDWQRLPRQGLKAVIDPMVFRCGELFLKGAKNAKDKSDTQELISKNTHALGMFFDSLILNEKIPIFNYEDTFDSRLNYNFGERSNTDEWTLARINEYDDVLWEIDVKYTPYHQVKSAALEELAKLYEGPKKVTEAMANDIIKELGTAGYNWNPSIENLEGKLTSKTEKTLAAYLLGALIFGGYAQQMETEHILQPKRSRILLALSTSSESTEHKLEEKLFGDLKKRAGTTYEELPWTPTFFPYLLSKANTPLALLAEVVKLRKSVEIQEYRTWLNEVLEDFKANGRIGIEKVKNVKSIAKHVDRLIGEIPSAPKVELKTSVADIAALKIPGSVDLTPALGQLWGWFLQNLPGRRYQKILTRAIIADHEYKKLDTRILTVWKGS